MLGIVGTIPDEGFPLCWGPARLDGAAIQFGEQRLAISRGTPALVAAALKTLDYLKRPAPYCYLVGDIGSGKGSERLYKHLTANIAEASLKVLALHYFQPKVALFRELLSSIKNLPNKPILVGDAGFMYVAKMSGDATAFDLLTPDAGELAYLADEKAPHPFYTRGFILHEDNLVPDLIQKAYRYNNGADFLLVKGETDYVANREGIIATIDSPKEEAMEAIGGTGDTLTGIVAALLSAGVTMEVAATQAARVNRLAGSLARPTPATQVVDIIEQIPQALAEVITSGN